MYIGNTELGRPRIRRLNSLMVRVALLCAAVGMLVLAEFVLAIFFTRTMEQRVGEFTAVDRRAHTLLMAAGKMNDFMSDLALANGRPANLVTTLVHWHTHLVALTPIEAEMKRQGRPLSQPSLGDALRASSEAQLSPDDQTFDNYLRLVRPLVENYSRESLHMLVEVDGLRKQLADEIRLYRERYVASMFTIGLIGLLVVAVFGAFFLFSLTRRLRLLRLKAAAIAEGDFGEPILNYHHDELGEVIEGMNTMASALAERTQQLEEVRLRFAQQEKMQALGTFATGIAHEIGNPIQAISALCYQVTDSLASDPSLENVQANSLLVDSIGAHADRLARTIAEIREFAHPVRHEFELVDLHQLLASTTALMRFDPRFKRVPISTDFRAVSPVISGVQDHLVQVVMNVLINAVDAVEQTAGAISLATEDADGGVSIIVRDNGMGMSEGVLAKACEPFFTTKPRTKGTGMGLAICQSIIEAHKGTMEISSQPGQGTTVTMTFRRG